MYGPLRLSFVLLANYVPKCQMSSGPHALADLGGACPAHAPYGTQFFCFCIHFHQKVPTLEVHAPLMGAHPPMGNPGSTTDMDLFLLTAIVTSITDGNTAMYNTITRWDWCYILSQR